MKTQKLTCMLGAFGFTFFAFEYNSFLCGIAAFICLVAALGE